MLLFFFFLLGSKSFCEELDGGGGGWLLYVCVTTFSQDNFLSDDVSGSIPYHPLTSRKRA